jgi:hypothetical protein
VPLPFIFISACLIVLIYSKIQSWEDLEKNVVNMFVITYPPSLPEHKKPNDDSNAKNKSQFSTYVIPLNRNPRIPMLLRVGGDDSGFSYVHCDFKGKPHNLSFPLKEVSKKVANC